MDAIDHLRATVEEHYGFKIKWWKVLRYRKTRPSLVVKVKTEKGEYYVLKCLYVTPGRQHFIVLLEQMLKAKGVPLARPLPTLKGTLYMKHKLIPYVLYEWIEGKHGQLRNKGDLRWIVRIMAKLHHASRHLVYSAGVTYVAQSDLKHNYEQRLKFMKSWYNNHKHSAEPNHVLICSHILFFCEIADLAVNALRSSPYFTHMDTVTRTSLVHGDLHQGNILIRRKKGVLIDFEDIRYDLPSKDLLQIFSIYSREHKFSIKAFRSMMKTYERHNPLAPDMRAFVYIDLLFPHIFERILRRKKYINRNFKLLKHEIKQERKKANYLYHRYFKHSEIVGRDFID